MRRLCVLAVIVVALGGCGDDADSAARLDTTGLAAIERLSSERYRTVDRALSSSVRFSELSRAGRLRERARFDAAVTRLLRACSALDGTDPLLRELFGSCASEAAVLVPLLRVRSCSSTTSCSEAFTTARSRLSDVTAAYSRHNRAVRATRLPAACARALTHTQDDYAYIRRQRAVFERFESAIAARSPARLDRAIAAQDRLDRVADDGERRTLRRFRAGCR